MDTFGVLGFTLGSTAFTFSIVAWAQISSLQKEVRDLKKSLDDAGVTKHQAAPD